MNFKAGHVAIVGRPNVGKSTLMNRLIGQKISITSRKAQTTRHQIRGVLTTEVCQCVFVDTPGFQSSYKDALGRFMNRSVLASLADVEVILLLIEAGRFDERDQAVLKVLPDDRPVVLVLSKTDRFKDKAQLLPFAEEMSRVRPFVDIVPVSADKREGLDRLVDVIAHHLPEGEPLYDADELTDRSERFLAAEFLREKLFRLLGDELPYGMTVEIDRYIEDGSLRRINATILVDKPAHKAMVIGKGGARLKQIATEARVDIERLLNGKVYLEVWVKVRGGWADDERALASLGYD